MTFLHLIAGLPVAGAETFLLRLVTEGATRGHKHVVINLGGETPLAKNMATYAEVVNLDIQKRPLSGIVNLFFCGIKWRKEAKSISGWMYYGSILAMLVGFGVKVQKLGHIRHTPISLANESWKIKAAIRMLKYFSRSLSCITYNSAHALEWHENFGILARHSCVIDNGYPVMKEPDFDVKCDGCAPFTIGAASRNHPMKNQLGLLRGFARLLEADPTFKLVLAGKGTEKLADSPEFDAVSSHVSLFGEVKNMTEFYDSLDLFVSFSSWGESFQNVVAEAMAHGVPALATDIGAARKIVIDDTCILPVGDELAFAEKVLQMRALSRETTEWTAYRKTLFTKISQQFSIARIYDQLLLE